MTLLIVDDEYYAIAGIKDGLDWTKLPFDEVLSAMDSNSAKEIFHTRAKEKKRVDVMLCDIEMPNGNGLSLASWVRECHPETVCIFLTCHGEFQFAQTAIRIGCFDYILKPPIPDVLSEVLLRAAEKVEEERISQKYAQYGKTFLESDEEPVSRKTDYVKDTVEFLRANIRNQYSTGELAERLGIGADHLTRMFRKKYDMTLTEYMTSLRMDIAKEMLEKGISPSHVSEAVGYYDYGYFSRSFKKQFNLSPKEYQKRMQHD